VRLNLLLTRGVVNEILPRFLHFFIGFGEKMNTGDVHKNSLGCLNFVKIGAVRATFCCGVSESVSVLSTATIRFECVTGVHIMLFNICAHFMKIGALKFFLLFWTWIQVR